jgi:hypothetical protein
VNKISDFPHSIETHRDIGAQICAISVASENNILVTWFVAAQLTMADRKSSTMERMVGALASSSSSSRTGRTVSIGTRWLLVVDADHE